MRRLELGVEALAMTVVLFASGGGSGDASNRPKEQYVCRVVGLLWVQEECPRLRSDDEGSGLSLEGGDEGSEVTLDL